MAKTYSTLAERLSQIEKSITTLQDNISNIKISPFRVVTELPSVTEAETEVIYFVPSSESGEENVYDEYAVINGAFEKVGTYATSVDLTQYATQDDIADMLTKTEASTTYQSKGNYAEEAAMLQISNSIGAFKVLNCLDDLGNLDTVPGAVAYYSYLTGPVPISSIKIGLENTYAAVGRFHVVKAVMPTVSGNIVIQFEGDPMSGLDSLFIITLQADESLTNLDAIIETGYGVTIPDYFWDSYNATIDDVEIDDELWTIHIIKDGVITQNGFLMFNYILSLSNRCYLSEINCSDITAFDNTLMFYGTEGVIPFELTDSQWRIEQAEYYRRLDKIKLGFTRIDSFVDYIDKVFNLLKK